ncbi:MAG: DUF1569 domain-containing protein [Maribacter sp.]
MIGTKFLEKELKQLKGYLPQIDTSNPQVSKVSVGWHLDHMLKTILHICKGLTSSDPSSYKKNFNALRMFCHTFNFIPRGKAQSPKYVLPPIEIKTEDILAQLAKAKTHLQNLKGLDPNANINHPFFKQLNLSQSKRFMQVHTNHHLKIIRDITKGT